MSKKSLRDVIIARTEVPVGGDQTIELRGVSLADITMLFNRHTAAMADIFDQFMALKKQNGEITPDFVGNFIFEGITQVPEMVAELICIANDDTEDEALAVAARLPATEQAECIMAILELSIRSEAELKKLVGVATKALGYVTTLIARIKSGPKEDQTAFRFPDGFGGSVKESASS